VKSTTSANNTDAALNWSAIVCGEACRNERKREQRRQRANPA
jgi:predicted nucleic acid-binding Zn ribbon protein